MSRFAIVKTTILTNNRGGHIHCLGTGQRNAVFEKVASFPCQDRSRCSRCFCTPRNHLRQSLRHRTDDSVKLLPTDTRAIWPDSFPRVFSPSWTGGPLADRSASQYDTNRPDCPQA
jgi:hypothetical protein